MTLPDDTPRTPLADVAGLPDDIRQELETITTCLAALEPLDAEARTRVLLWLSNKLDADI